MAGCVGGGVMLMFEIDAGGDKAADPVLNISSKPLGSQNEVMVRPAVVCG
ncbi:MAG: hypothetical protein ACLSB9_27225 [Hydrogeniiclostridium mannosilyticum]